jgi:hypothetical protein
MFFFFWGKKKTKPESKNHQFWFFQKFQKIAGFDNNNFKKKIRYLEWAVL